MSSLRNIRIFLSVYRSLSITQSAKELYLTQPAVSQAILDLEQEYGVRLFDRINRKLVPTQASQLFYTHALRISESYDSLAQDMDEYDKGGGFSVGCTEALANADLFAALQAVRADHPGIRIGLTVGSGMAIYEGLKKNELDLALIEGFHHASADFEIRELKRDRLVAVLPVHHALSEKGELSLQEISAYPLIMRGPGSSGHSVIEAAFTAAGIVPDVFCESSSVTVILRMITEGFGISILPEGLTAEAASSGRITVKKLAGDGFVRSNRLLYRKGKYFNQPARELIDRISLPQ